MKERQVLEMEKELSSCLVLLEVMGLQHFSLKTLTKESFKKPMSTSRKIYFLFVLVLFLALMFACLVINRLNPVKHVTAKNILMLAIRNTTTFGLLIITVISIIQAYATTKSVEKLFLNTKELATLCLKEYHLFIDFKKIKKLVWRQIACIILFVIALHLVLAPFEERKFSLDILILTLFRPVPVFFLMMISFKFTFYVEMVNNQLKFLENLTKSINDFNSAELENKLMISVAPVHQQWNEDLMNKLQTAWKIYNLIYENGGLINKSHGLTILAMLTVLVIALTASGYEIFVLIIGDNKSIKFSKIIYVFTIAIAILSLIVTFCQKTHHIVSWKFLFYFLNFH